MKAILFALASLIGLAGCAPAAVGPTWNGLGDPGKGKAVIAAAQCGACHDIPGVIGADGRVGPPLAGFARRTIIAGLLPNTPTDLVRWLRTPQAVKPGDAMPDTGLSEQQAKDAAAYLYSLH